FVSDRLTVRIRPAAPASFARLLLRTPLTLLTSPSCPDLIRASIFFAKTSYEDDCPSPGPRHSASKTRVNALPLSPLRGARVYPCGFHSRARFCASASCAEVISLATVSRFLTAAARLRASVGGKRAAARLNHICAAIASCATPSPRA